MVQFKSLKRTTKRLFLIAVSFCTGIFIIVSRKTENNVTNPDVMPIFRKTLPNLNLIEYLPGSAKPCSGKVPHLLAFVHSSPTHIPHREAIRKTWGNSVQQDIKTVFILGRSKNEKVWKKIQQEAEDYGDLIYLNIMDTYKNLTLKHLLGIKWVVANCPQAPYVLKADDDTFVDTKRLLPTLDILLGFTSGSKNSLICHVIPEGSSPKRSGKWMVTQEEYPYEEYPEYCSGLAYFTRMSTLKEISEVALSGSVPYLSIDDIFVTGMAAALAGVNRQDLGVRFASNEQPVVQWLKSKSIRPCPWMVTEMSSYYWPKEAFNLWNKTVLSWQKYKNQ